MTKQRAEYGRDYQETYDSSCAFLREAEPYEWEGWLQATADMLAAKHLPGADSARQALDCYRLAHSIPVAGGRKGCLK